MIFLLGINSDCLTLSSVIVSFLKFMSDSNRNPRFTIVDQRNQHVDHQINTVVDQRDQRDQSVNTHYNIMGEDPTALLAVINRNTRGVKFNSRVAGVWFGVSFVTAIVMVASSATNGTAVSLPYFFMAWFVTCAGYFSYGFIGILIQAAIHYHWQFSAVRNSWFVWYIYPFISLLGIALWMVWGSVKYGPKMFWNPFRF
jgi:hypothetical protein